MWILSWLLWLPATADQVSPGVFTQDQCLACHGERDSALVARWRGGPHAVAANCIDCHGDRHAGLPLTRADAVCTRCHDGAVAQSYANSKHGVLVRLGRPEWRRPLRRGEYRAPGCAYCHLHDGDHGDSMAPERGPEVRQWLCSACHAPRYVADQFSAGERLLAIARLKAQEAEILAARHPRGAAAVKDQLASVAKHLTNIRLGAGHQSPDYQWWHGQPALDGDLIRLREAVALAATAPVDPPAIPAPVATSNGAITPRRSE